MWVRLRRPHVLPDRDTYKERVVTKATDANYKAMHAYYVARQEVERAARGRDRGA